MKSLTGQMLTTKTMSNSAGAYWANGQVKEAVALLKHAVDMTTTMRNILARFRGQSPADPQGAGQIRLVSFNSIPQ